jgi:hypothetical protein
MTKITLKSSVKTCIANKGIGLWAHDKSESTQGRGEDR